MTHQPYDERREPTRLSDILDSEETHPTFGRQMANGLSGLLVLMATGIAIVLLVLWKSP